MNLDTYLKLVTDFQKRFDDLGYKENFRNDYFGVDICNSEFVSVIKNQQYPSWLFDIVTDPHNYHDHYIMVKKTETGGASGGNCWGDDAEYYSCNDETQIVTNEKFQEVFGFALSEIPIFEMSETITEYYGNYSNFKFHFVLKYDILYKFSRVAKIEKFLK